MNGRDRRRVNDLLEELGYGPRAHLEEPVQEQKEPGPEPAPVPRFPGTPRGSGGVGKGGLTPDAEREPDGFDIARQIGRGLRR